MNLTKLFEMQKVLKDRIGYNGDDKFEKMLLALIVEIGETANDWRKFKYWSTNQESKTTLLEEYVDGVHFVLETGLDLLENGEIMMLPKEAFVKVYKEVDVVDQFKEILSDVLSIDYEVKYGDSYLDNEYIDLLENYLTLGQMLGFTEEQIEKAYMDKNKVNHQRQDSGY